MQEAWDRAPQIVATANAWHEGQPIPSRLRSWYRSPGDLPTPIDTDVLINQIHNLSLLSTLAVDKDADPRCREEAYQQGLYAVGPGRFFGLIAARVGSASIGENQWLLDLRTRISRRHVVVDALDIRDSDMSAAEASAVFERIEADLKRGEPWHKVYKRYSEEFGYRTANRTQIGNLGHFVVFADPALGTGYYDEQPGVIQWHGEPLPPRLGRLEFFEPSHLPNLMKANARDVLRLRDNFHKEWVLYQVQEVYEGIGRPDDVQHQ
jgi:hypothetical protein